VVRAAQERFGTIDVLVNNAGHGYRAAVEEAAEDQVPELWVRQAQIPSGKRCAGLASQTIDAPARRRSTIPASLGPQVRMKKSAHRRYTLRASVERGRVAVGLPSVTPAGETGIQELASAPGADVRGIRFRIRSPAAFPQPSPAGGTT
jgi:hypothetical protein